jgi:uncharacterized protein YndB with AHSA1/START domain
MPSYRTSATIKRPIADVFAYLTDVRAWPKWMNVESTEPVAPGPPSVGAKAEGVMSEGGKSTPLSIEITKLEPGRLIAFRTLSGPVDWQGSWEVNAVDDQTTEVTAEGMMRLQGLKRLLEPLMAGEIRKSEAAELERLRTVLEAR